MAIVIDFGEQGGEAHFAFFGDGPEFVPKGVFEGYAGPVTVERGGMLADQICVFPN